MTTPISQSVDTLAGRTSTAPFITAIFARAPTGNDGINGQYQIGQRWIDTSNANEEWFLLNLISSNGIVQANWVQLGGSVNAESLTGNSGGAVFPDGSQNINVVGDGTTVNVIGDPGTHTLTISAVSSGDVASITATSPLTANGISGTPETGAVTIALSGPVPVGPLTEHASLVGGASNNIVSVGPSGILGAPLISGGLTADPVFSTTFRIADSVSSAFLNSVQSGSSVLFQAVNQATTALSGAGFNAAVAASVNAGVNPFFLWSVNNAAIWIAGPQQNDGNAWKLSQGAVLGTNDAIVVTTSGDVTKPLQPAFFSVLSITDANVTGDGTGYILGQGNILTLLNNQGTGISTNGTFTAPVNGFYRFSASIYMSGLTGAMTNGVFYFLVNGSNTIYGESNNSGAMRNASNILIVNITSEFLLGAGGTVQVAATLSNGAKVVSINGGLVGAATQFSGCLLC